MAKRLSDTEIWDKEWFMQLSPTLKCLVKYVRDKCDMIGIWKPNWSLAKTQIGEDVNESDLLSIDLGKQFKKINNKIVCIDFITFQYGENLNTKSPIHIKINSLLKKSGYTIEGLCNTVSIPYPYPTDTLSSTLLPTLSNTPQEKEEVKREVEVKEEVKVDVSDTCVFSDLSKELSKPENESTLQQQYMGNGRDFSNLKRDLKDLHAWMVKKDNYPINRKQAFAYVHTWLTSQYYKSNNLHPQQRHMAKDD